MKVLITNTVTLNGGDAAILLAIVRLLRDVFGGDADVTVMDSAPQAASRYYPELDFLPSPHGFVSDACTMQYVRGVLRPIHRVRLKLAAQSIYQRVNDGTGESERRAPAQGRRGASGLARLATADERRTLRAFSDADLVVATGGTYLVPAYNLQSRFYDFEFPRMAGRPLALFTQSLGPFRDAPSRRAMRRVVDDSVLVLLRDERSRRHLLDLGADPDRLHVTADAAFALAGGSRGIAGESVSDPPKFDRPIPQGDRLRVAISVRHWPHFRTTSTKEGMDRYVASVRAAVNRLVRDHGAQVIFLSTCQGTPEYWTDDAAVAQRIVDHLQEDVQEHVRVDNAFHRPEELIDRLAEFDIAIATRMHAAILAMVAGTPVLPVAYEFKTTELFQRFDLGEWVQDIERLEANDLANDVQAFLEELPDLRGRFAAGVAEEVRRAWESSRLLRDAYYEISAGHWAKRGPHGDRTELSRGGT